ncbi:hypothetical protein K3495_g9660 [Podosphaera aphanis]|nr:hypothetical protein K3495_g9660 [Podosphaera aphanis]
MTYRDGYSHWPFVTQSEFDLACAFFDQKYVRAKLGKARLTFKLRPGWVATTGTSYIEILRPLVPYANVEELSVALQSLGIVQDDATGCDIKVDSMDEDGDEEALCPSALPPKYSSLSDQPYVTYEIHLHPTYRVPTLWFTLHGLRRPEQLPNLESVYRYLVPPQDQGKLMSAGITGGLSAAPHPVTHVPAFFIHPCQTKEAMEAFDCPLEDYLMVWIGLVGGCVGLWLPPEMAQTN